MSPLKSGLFASPPWGTVAVAAMALGLAEAVLLCTIITRSARSPRTTVLNRLGFDAWINFVAGNDFLSYFRAEQFLDVAQQFHHSGAASALVRLSIGTDYLLAQITRRSLARLDLKKGDRVFAQVKSVTVRH